MSYNEKVLSCTEREGINWYFKVKLFLRHIVARQYVAG